MYFVTVHNRIDNERACINRFPKFNMLFQPIFNNNFFQIFLIYIEIMG